MMDETIGMSRKCEKCGGIIWKKGMPFLATGDECTCNREINIDLDKFKRRDK